MKQVMVRYKVKPDQTAKNEELVRAVYDETAAHRIRGLGTRTFKLDDDLSFVHNCGRDRRRAAFAGRRRGVQGVHEGHRRALRSAPGGHRAS